MTGILEPAVLAGLALSCAPMVDERTTHALVAVESGRNPHAIGVVGGALQRQPRHRAEALATAYALQGNGWDFSVGLAQINVRNLRRMGLSLEQAFEPCTNLRAMQDILGDCYARSSGRAAPAGDATREAAAAGSPAHPQQRLRAALSCYYSGNFLTGFRHGYVARVVDAARRARPPPAP